MQVLLVFLLYAFPAEEAQDPYEINLHKKRLMVEKAIRGWPRMRLNDSIPEEREALEICLHDHTVPYSQSLLIFVWVIRAIPVLSRVLWSVYVVCLRLDTVQANDMVIVSRQHQVAIMHMTETLRIVTLCVQVPDLFCNLLVLVVGARFLFYAADIRMLITKTIGLFWLLQLDSVIFEGITGHWMKDQIRNTAFSWQEKRTTGCLHFHRWGSSLLRLGLVLSLVLSYTRLYHSELQLLRALCLEYKQEYHKVCSTCGLKVMGHFFYPA